MIDEDEIAWHKYPQHRKWFNKLYVADLFGYSCGPAGISVPKPNNYVVRPIYNLAGMGVGATVQFLTPDDLQKVPPGYFWVEQFYGTHYSFDYVRINGKFQQLNCYIGTNSPDNLSLFTKWVRDEETCELPWVLEELHVEKLNIEVIGDKIIEVHLRNGFDHMMWYKEIIPVFEGDSTERDGYTYVKGPADGYGHLTRPRIGYLVS